MKSEEMADIFLNSANFVPHAFLTLAPPSGYALNLKSLINVSKVSWTSQLSYETLRSSLERKFDKTNFISHKKDTSQKPMCFRVNKNQVYLFSVRNIKIWKKRILPTVLIMGQFWTIQKIAPKFSLMPLWSQHLCLSVMLSAVYTLAHLTQNIKAVKYLKFPIVGLDQKIWN